MTLHDFKRIHKGSDIKTFRSKGPVTDYLMVVDNELVYEIILNVDETYFVDLYPGLVYEVDWNKFERFYNKSLELGALIGLESRLMKKNNLKGRG